MPISPYPVNKLFAVEAILQVVGRHCGLPKTTKAALAPLRSRTFKYGCPVSFFQPSSGLKQRLFLYNVLPPKVLRLSLYRKFACKCFLLSTSAAGFACFAAALIIDTV